MSTDTTRPRRQSFQHKARSKEVRFGSYILGSTLGEGEFGKVKLCWRKDGKQPSQVAIKFIRRESIPRGSERESKVHREINALKRLTHPNIIRLEEVLQNDKYIGIVLEYASGGELFDYILQHRYLKDSLACRLFAQLVSGVYYMHSKGIVHRDLKLENLLLDKHKNIVITDFGFVNSFTSESELMKTSCGSPCYAAPELVISNEPYEARKVDIWSCGVILYAMLAGYLPFDDDPQNPDGDNIARLYQYITTTPLTFPEYVEPMPRDLLRRILVSNPKKRLNLKEIRSHSWLVSHAPFLSVTPAEWDENIRTANKVESMAFAQQRFKDKSTSKNDYRRYSLIESVPSLHSHNSNSGTNQQMLYSNPLPPQTSSSHAMAIPSSASSTSIQEQLKIGTPKGHTRTNSVQSYTSASLALQAVVDADEIRNHSSSPPLPSSSSAYGLDSFVRHNSDTKIKGNIPRSTTHTGIANLSNFSREQQQGISTIEESPAKTGKHVQGSDVHTDFIVPKIPMNSNNYHQAIGTQKLPGPKGGRRPRPTSYHPGYYSTGMSQDQLDYRNSTQMANQVSTTQFGRSESTNSVASLANQKISAPSVELVQAEGDITSPKSPLMSAKTFNGIETSENHENFCVDAIEKSQADLSSSSISQKKQNRYSAVIAAEVLMEKLFNTGDIHTANDGDLSKLDSHISNGTKSNISTTTKDTSVTGSPDTENQQLSRAPAKTNSNSRNKRFSFLGFYSAQPDSRSSISVDSSNQKRTNKKKVLEPSNGANINNPKNEAAIQYTSFEQRKEPSTARKVMDFFKRRSLRM